MALKCSIEAFFITEKMNNLLELANVSPKLSRCTLSHHSGGMNKAISHLSKSPSPDLLIIEVNSSQEVIFQKLESLSTVFDSESRILLVGNENDIELYRKLKALGINEYLFMPETADGD